jgi:two-component system, NtrC family, sensor kinase
VARRAPVRGNNAVKMPIRVKLVLASLILFIVLAFGITALNLARSRRWVEQDLEESAVSFARAVAATIGDRREFESSALLEAQIREILAIRPNVVQVDVLAFSPEGSRVVATSAGHVRMPFTRRDANRVLGGEVVARLVAGGSVRYWEVMAPVRLQNETVGAIAAKFSLAEADRRAIQLRRWSLTLTVVGVLVMAALMIATVRRVVDRPLGQLMRAIDRVEGGDGQARVAIDTRDEFSVLGTHFNRMVGQIAAFHDELQAQVRAATTALDQRVREVERLNRELFGTQRRLGHVERLALAGRIMSQVAHEVGTPLHSVAGHLELLRSDLAGAPLPDAAERRLKIIETELARVGDIIRQLLDLSRGAPEPPQPVDLAQLLRVTVELLRPTLAAAHVAVEMAVESDLPLVLGQAGPLQQVLLNLLTNAMDAMPEGGRVTVTAGAGSPRHEVELAVADTGTGIPPEHVAQIFEPFFSTKTGRHGTGLGLFISQAIVRDHHGRIEVDSAEGEGSTFRIVLPAKGSG